MGCDIHLYLEGKRTICGDKKWISLDHFRLNPYYGTDPSEEEYSVVSIYSSRNYWLFSILAGVRDYSGNKPIAEPKGMPEDCCDIIKAACEHWDGDGHSHSYFTLRELQDYADSHTKVKYSGMVSANAADLLDKGEAVPSTWCQATNSPGWVYREWEVENTVLDRLIEKIRERAKEDLWLWTDESLDERLDEVRIVFWFDN